MINDRILKLADELKGELKAQQSLAFKAIADIPEGKTKDDLKKLLAKAGSGEVAFEDIQKEINKIVQNAN